MKTPSLILALALVAACTPQEEDRAADTAAEAAPAAAPAPAQPAVAPAKEAAAAPEAETASATGVVEAVDTDAGSVTIAHGEIDAFGWPPMTMTFPAPGLDLAAISQGDQVTVELSRTGSMEATITGITREPPVQ